jgi:hypothetical protein
VHPDIGIHQFITSKSQLLHFPRAFFRDTLGNISLKGLFLKCHLVKRKISAFEIQIDDPRHPAAMLRLAFLVLLGGSSALLVQGPRAVSTPQRAVVSRLRLPPTMQFGGNKNEPKGLSRDAEPDQFFKTNMDDMSDAEKIKSPVVIAGLLLLIGPFIIGAIALQFYR